MKLASQFSEVSSFLSATGSLEDFSVQIKKMFSKLRSSRLASVKLFENLRELERQVLCSGNSAFIELFERELANQKTVTEDAREVVLKKSKALDGALKTWIESLVVKRAAEFETLLGSKRSDYNMEKKVRMACRNGEALATFSCRSSMGSDTTISSTEGDGLTIGLRRQLKDTRLNSANNAVARTKGASFRTQASNRVGFGSSESRNLVSASSKAPATSRVTGAKGIAASGTKQQQQLPAGSVRLAFPPEVLESMSPDTKEKYSFFKQKAEALAAMSLTAENPGLRFSIRGCANPEVSGEFLLDVMEATSEVVLVCIFVNLDAPLNEFEPVSAPHHRVSFHPKTNRPEQLGCRHHCLRKLPWVIADVEKYKNFWPSYTDLSLTDVNADTAVGEAQDVAAVIKPAADVAAAYGEDKPAAEGGAVGAEDNVEPALTEAEAQIAALTVVCEKVSAGLKKMRPEVTFGYRFQLCGDGRMYDIVFGDMTTHRPIYHLKIAPTNSAVAVLKYAQSILPLDQHIFTRGPSAASASASRKAPAKTTTAAPSAVGKTSTSAGIKATASSGSSVPAATKSARATARVAAAAASAAISTASSATTTEATAKKRRAEKAVEKAPTAKRSAGK